MKKAAFHFKPFSPKQRMIFTWWQNTSPVHDADGIICDGAIRTGKTVCMSLSFIMWSMEKFNGQRFAMCGKTIGSFRRNVLSCLTQTLGGRGYSYSDKRADNLLIVRRGSVVNYYHIFGGRDESSQDLIQGMTLAGIFLDEVALMPESFVQQATSRCSVDGSKFWFNCNPAGASHWFKKSWVDAVEKRNLLRLKFRMEDNLSLSPKVRQRYENQYSGAFYQRYILGLWVAADGLVYDGFNREIHVPTQLPETEGAYYVSVDYGTLNPTAFLLWQKERNGSRWCCLKEYYFSGREAQQSGHGRQKTDSELADDLTAWLEGIRPRAIVVDPSAASFIAELRRRVFPVQQADNSVLDGIREVAALLNAGQLLFSRRCTRTIEEFSEYIWDEKASSRGVDAVVKEHDHAMDAMRYFVKTVLSRGRARGIRRPAGM